MQEFEHPERLVSFRIELRMVCSRRYYEHALPPHFLKPRAQRASHKGNSKMKKLLAVVLSLFFVSTIAVVAQNQGSSTTGTSASAGARKRGPVFRATKDQINQAQSQLKSRGFYSGAQSGKLDDATRDGLKKFQTAENIKVTGTLNKMTLEKMGIQLTDKQKTM
jgi:hypothetical protein